MFPPPLSRVLPTLVAATAAGVLAAGCGSDDDGATAVEIYAHRGGSLTTASGHVIAVHPENSMSAFRAAHADGFTIELDAQLV